MKELPKLADIGRIGGADFLAAARNVDRVDRAVAAIDPARLAADAMKPQEPQSPAAEANRDLARGAAAWSAVKVVMDQRSQANPSLMSLWAFREITRILDLLYSTEDGEIMLGDQTLGKGFADTKTGGATAPESAKPAAPEDDTPEK